MSKIMLKKEDVDLGKEFIESQINTDFNEVKYDENLNSFIVSNIIPSTKFFEYRLNNTDSMIEKLTIDMDNKFAGMDNKFVAMQTDMDKRFDLMQTDMDNKFAAMQTDMDKRFEQVDKRFEQVDKRFDAMSSDFKDMDRKFDKKFDQLFLLLENRDKEMRNMIYDNAKEQRDYTRNMFTASISISILGILGIFLKMAGVFG